MSLHTAALTSWSLALLAGLLMAMLWLFTYDRDRKVKLLSAIVVPVHALLAASGLYLWIVYLVYGQPWGWASLGTLLSAVLVGLMMAGRWLRVRHLVTRAENLPMAIVITHGALAVSTVALVVAALA